MKYGTLTALSLFSLLSISALAASGLAAETKTEIKGAPARTLIQALTYAGHALEESEEDAVFSQVVDGLGCLVTSYPKASPSEALFATYDTTCFDRQSKGLHESIVISQVLGRAISPSCDAGGDCNFGPLDVICNVSKVQTRVDQRFKCTLFQRR
jgi:hypothetical protein